MDQMKKDEDRAAVFILLIPAWFLVLPGPDLTPAIGQLGSRAFH